MSYVNIYYVIHFIGSFLLQRLCIRPLLQAQVHWKEQVPDPGDGFWLAGLPSWEEHQGIFKVLSKYETFFFKCND